MTRKYQFTLSITLIFVCACNSSLATTPEATPIQITQTAERHLTTTANTPTQVNQFERTILTFDELTNGFNSDTPVDDFALAMPDSAESPQHIFEGRLELLGEDSVGAYLVHRGDPNLADEVPHLPEFNYGFVQNGDYFIPVQRGLIITDHPNWNYILEPGRVWHENGDSTYSRVSFPFALVWKGSNAIFNGVMTFLFNDESISKVWYQTTQETTGSLRADFWGMLEAKYHPAPVKHSERIKSEFSNEISDRFPTKPIEQLAEDYPQVDVSRFGRGVSSKHMTYYGFVINGINYVSGCRTRYGEYAYCESMRAPSYSTAKSAFVSLVLMRLAQKYDPGVSELLIRDYVSEYENSPGDWSKVTFNHTLDMATGNFRSSDPMADEENFDTDPFWNEEYYAEKIAAAFNWPHSTDPGEQWVYRTFDTFILTRAMQNFLQTFEGPDADIFNFLVAEIFTPLKIGPGAHSTLRTKDNNWQGQPYGGYGLWWIADDIAKFTAFLNVDQGSINGEQILHPGLLAAAMQRDPDDRGVDINSTSKYNNAFWARKYTQRDSYDCEFWVPHMLGYSGIVIVLMPNGTTYYYASDNQEFTWLEAIKESDKIIPQCQPPTTTILSQQGTLGDIAYRPTDGVEMVFVPGGTFQMGSEQTDPAAGLSEYPQHPVTLDSFWIDKTELPNTSYLNCVNDGACRESRYSKDPAYNGADLPVVGVSWQDAADYCVWVGGRLPTEAEWEYTARSHEGYLYPWGDEFDGNLVNYCDVNCQESWADSEVDDGFSENAPVGSFPDGSSWVGALDLAGNVWEWVSDWYSDYLPAKQINPTGPPIGEHKVIRGGCWANQMDGVRTVYRIPDGGDISPDLRHSNIGFRCVLSPDLSMNN